MQTIFALSKSFAAFLGDQVHLSRQLIVFPAASIPLRPDMLSIQATPHNGQARFGLSVPVATDRASHFKQIAKPDSLAAAAPMAGCLIPRRADQLVTKPQEFRRCLASLGRNA